jgi:hypothetical protein
MWRFIRNTEIDAWLGFRANVALWRQFSEGSATLPRQYVQYLAKWLESMLSLFSMVSWPPLRCLIDAYQTGDVEPSSQDTPRAHSQIGDWFECQGTFIQLTWHKLQ